VVFIAHSLQSLMNKRQIVPLTVLILLLRKNKVRLLVAGRTCNDLSVVNSSCVRSRPLGIVHYESVVSASLSFDKSLMLRSGVSHRLRTRFPKMTPHGSRIFFDLFRIRLGSHRVDVHRKSGLEIFQHFPAHGRTLIHELVALLKWISFARSTISLKSRLLTSYS
jgi:hypothetical protein